MKSEFHHYYLYPTKAKLRITAKVVDSSETDLTSNGARRKSSMSNRKMSQKTIENITILTSENSGEASESEIIGFIPDIDASRPHLVILL